MVFDNLNQCIQVPVKCTSVYYRRVPIVATLVTFGISSLWGSLLSGGRYFRGVVTFGEQKSFTNKAGTSFFSEIKNEQHKIKKRTTFYLHSICIDCVS